MAARLLGGLLVTILAGCAGQGPDTGQARNNLKAQAKAMGQAKVQDDHVRVAEWTHPALIESAGGQPSYLQQLKAASDDFKKAGFRITTFTFAEPSELVESGRELYAIVPCEQRISGPGGKGGTQPSFLIAVSADRGNTWRFIDGGSMAGDRAKLTRALPNFPKSLTLPEPREPTFDEM